MQLRRKRSKEVLFYAQSCLIGGLCEGKSRCSRSWWGAVPLLAGGFFIANLLQLLMRVTLVQAISRSFYLQHTDCNRKPYSCFDCRWSILLWDSIVDSSADWRHWLSLFHLAAREGDVHRPNPSSIGSGEGPQRSCWLGLFNMELMLVYLSTVSLAVTATLTLKAERRPVVTSFSIQMNLMNLIFIPVAYSDLSDMDSCCGYDTEDESKVITLTLVLYVIATALFKQPATVARWLFIRPDYQISVGVSSNSRYLTTDTKINDFSQSGDQLFYSDEPDEPHFCPGCIQWPLWHGQLLWLWHWGWK